MKLDELITSWTKYRGHCTTEDLQALQYAFEWSQKRDTGYAYWICPHCGGQLIWGNDEMCADIYPEDYKDDDQAIWSIYTCSKCGATIECWDAPQEDKEE